MWIYPKGLAQSGKVNTSIFILKELIILGCTFICLLAKWDEMIGTVLMSIREKSLHTQTGVFN